MGVGELCVDGAGFGGTLSSLFAFPCTGGSSSLLSWPSVRRGETYGGSFRKGGRNCQDGDGYRRAEARLSWLSPPGTRTFYTAWPLPPQSAGGFLTLAVRSQSLT